MKDFLRTAGGGRRDTGDGSGWEKKEFSNTLFFHFKIRCSVFNIRISINQSTKNDSDLASG